MELLMNVYSGAVAVALMNLCFEPRFSGAASWGLSLLGAAAYTGAVSLLNWITPFEGLAAVGYALLMFLYGAAARKGRALDKLVLGLMWDNLLILAPPWELCWPGPCPAGSLLHGLRGGGKGAGPEGRRPFCGWPPPPGLCACSGAFGFGTGGLFGLWPSISLPGPGGPSWPLKPFGPAGGRRGCPFISCFLWL